MSLWLLLWLLNTTPFFCITAQQKTCCVIGPYYPYRNCPKISSRGGGIPQIWIGRGCAAGSSRWYPCRHFSKKGVILAILPKKYTKFLHFENQTYCRDFFKWKMGPMFRDRLAKNRLIFAGHFCGTSPNVFNNMWVTPGTISNIYYKYTFK